MSTHQMHQISRTCRRPLRCLPLLVEHTGMLQASRVSMLSACKADGKWSVTDSWSWSWSREAGLRVADQSPGWLCGTAELSSDGFQSARGLGWVTASYLAGQVWDGLRGQTRLKCDCKTD